MVRVYYDGTKRQWKEGIGLVEPGHRGIGEPIKGPDTIGWFTFKTNPEGKKHVVLNTLTSEKPLVPAIPLRIDPRDRFPIPQTL